MPTIFLATLGQRPEAITVALDALLQRGEPLALVVILHTEPTRSGITGALADIRYEMHRAYPQLPVECYELKRSDGGALYDIDDAETAQDYFAAVLTALESYRVLGSSRHLLVAGGRKAMTIYATLAASFSFGGHDRVWTVLTPSEDLKPGQFHIPRGRRDRVQLVQLPLLTARLLARRQTESTESHTGIIDAEQVMALLHQRASVRDDFWGRLTDREQIVAATLAENPYASDEALAKILGRSVRTVQNQLSHIYSKMEAFFDDSARSDRMADKRRLLIDLMNGRLDE